MELQHDALEYSIARAINDRRQRAVDGKNPPFLFDVVLRMARRLPVMFPYEVLCCSRLQVSDNLYARSVSLDAVFLLQRGWSLPMSLMLWRNFRAAYPLLRFQPEAHQVLTRQQLQEEYGPFGDVIADVCVDPDKQPVIAALLYNRFEEGIERPCTLAVASLEVTAELGQDWSKILDAADLPVTLKFMSSFGEVVDEPTTLSETSAQNIFKAATGGGTLQTRFSLHPLDIDYGNPEKALR